MQTRITLRLDANAYPSSYHTFGLSVVMSAKQTVAVRIRSSIESIVTATEGSRSTLYASKPTCLSAGLKISSYLLSNLPESNGWITKHVGIGTPHKLDLLLPVFGIIPPMVRRLEVLHKEHWSRLGRRHRSSILPCTHHRGDVVSESDPCWQLLQGTTDGQGLNELPPESWNACFELLPASDTPRVASPKQSLEQGALGVGNIFQHSGSGQLKRRCTAWPSVTPKLWTPDFIRSRKYRP